MKARSLITLVIVILIVCVIVFFGMTGFSVGIYRVDPLYQQVNLGLDLTGGVYAVYQVDQGDFTAEQFAAKFDTTLSVLRKRLDEKGFTEASVVAQGSNRIRVEIPINATTDTVTQETDEIVAFLSETGLLEFQNAAGETKLTGSNVVQANPTYDSQTSEPLVAIQFDAEGGDLFYELTKDAYENRTAINMLLDGELISSANVEKGAIAGGSAVISGGDANPFTIEQATNLAIQIESGALPLVLDEIENRSISASLGEDALSKSILAGFIGIALLFLFMLVYYRLPGLVACVALSIYMFIILLLLAAIPAIQLTLPGIAGIILGIGMAVDSNVIIFERFKEEYAAGKTLRPALNSGFSKALRTILDSNITTIIAAIVISIFGVGAVKGFGYTLIISIVTSMFTAIIVTKSLLRLIMNLNIRSPWLYTIRKPLTDAKGGE
jgi:preprotein translocase subunit SecD